MAGFSQLFYCSLNHSLFNFISKENEQRAHIELGEMKGNVLKSYHISPIKLFRTTAEVPQLTWQSRFSFCSFCHILYFGKEHGTVTKLLCRTGFGESCFIAH